MTDNVNDQDMRDALILGLAQQIARSWLHRRQPDMTDSEIRAAARNDLREMEAQGYTFTGFGAAELADAAARLAQDQMDRNVNFADWAFGH